MAYQVGRCLLRQKLIDAGMEQTELASRLNVTKQQVNKYVMNRQIMALETAKNVAVILDCRIEQLYEWIEVGNTE